MKLKPGCGCLLIILAIINLVMAIGCIVFTINVPTATTTAPRASLYGAAAVLFASNVGASGLLGLAAFRGVSIGRKPVAQDEDDMTEEQSTYSTNEGTDEGAD
jgi:hypothetical protein